ncbi:branched-chain amino acid transport protein [Striga asiatica]|uniref:Branched-chain amino acid transport protein n=1 Tax=Striga asiatica TaxID=4170 RepID=A0A5A7QP67_STRAF|nr:branched-chain amino acid transport protein [Striga asiatica]
MQIIKLKQKNSKKTGPSSFYWAKAAPARYPPTVERGKLSLLCEASLTQCPPLYGPRSPSLRMDHAAQLPTWNGRASLSLPKAQLVGQAHCPITLMPLLRLQAGVTQLGDRIFSHAHSTARSPLAIITPSGFPIFIASRTNSGSFSNPPRVSIFNTTPKFETFLFSSSRRKTTMSPTSRINETPTMSALAATKSRSTRSFDVSPSYRISLSGMFIDFSEPSFVPLGPA